MFRLAAEAHRISLAYLFDPLLAVHISNVEPLPHQIAAVIAPELLCPDRRNGVISLYLVRPLTITDYVLGRWLAFFAITLLLVYSGQIVFLAGLILSAAEPLDYLRDNWSDVPRILGAGLLVAIFIFGFPFCEMAIRTNYGQG